VSAYPPYAFDRPPAVVKIGGLFTPFRKDGSLDVEQAECLQAFLMAINEINNKSDGVMDDLLPNTELVYAVANRISDDIEAIEGTKYLIHSFYDSGVSGVVNCLSSNMALTTALVSTDKQLFQVFSFASDSSLGRGLEFPYKAQTNVLDSFVGKVLQELLCEYYHARTVVTIFSGDEYGSKSILEFLSHTYCAIDVLASFKFAEGSLDFADIIRDAKATGGLIFVLFMSPLEAAAFIWQAYEGGLLVEGTQVIVSDSTNMTSYFPAGADVVGALRGVLSVDYWADYSTIARPEGQAFVERWSRQKYDVPYSSTYCSHKLDDNGAHYVYSNALHTSSCAQLNISSYASGASRLGSHVSLTYDATYLLALGIDIVLSSGQNITAETLRDAILDHVSFTGASGHIDIYEGMDLEGKYGRGDREVGVFYRLLNFNEDSFRSHGPSGAFVTLGVWDLDQATLEPCPPGYSCHDPIYRTRDNSFPPDTHPDIILEMAPGLRALLFSLAAIVFALTLFVSVVVVWNRKHSEVKRAQEVMLYFILAGIMLGGGRVLVAALDLTDSTCTLGLWLGHMGYALCFGGLFMKSWRVNMILNTRTIRRVVITNTDVLLRMLVGLSSCVGYMCVVTFVAEPHFATSVSFSANQRTVEYFCSFEESGYHTALLIVEACFLMYGTALCWASRNVPDKFNESANNAVGEWRVVGVVSLDVARCCEQSICQDQICFVYAACFLYTCALCYVIHRSNV
jgi:ABC-type branched-subunit amino acid transport system substrate-binding protein